MWIVHYCNTDRLNRSNNVVIEWKHPAGSKGDRFDFRIDCHRRCRNIDINVSHSSGDVDLYGEDEHVPTIK